MLEAYIYDGLRTPFGRHAGAISKVRPDDLLAGVIKAAVTRSGFAPETIDDVAIGCTNQAGEDSRCVARHALLLAGLPIETPGVVHNRLYGKNPQRPGGVLFNAVSGEVRDNEIVVPGTALLLSGKPEKAILTITVNFTLPRPTTPVA